MDGEDSSHGGSLRESLGDEDDDGVIQDDDDDFVLEDEEEVDEDDEDEEEEADVRLNRMAKRGAPLGPRSLSNATHNFNSSVYRGIYGDRSGVLKVSSSFLSVSSSLSLFHFFILIKYSLHGTAD
jgi:hypothetical protein